MTLRWQLPVHSPVRIGALAAGAWAALRGDAGEVERFRAMLAARHGARLVVPTDSGTSALVLALRALAPAGGTVALPGWACIDLTAAAVLAGVRVRLYDQAPDTMSPDLDSVERVLARGVDAIVVAHLYGYPADVPAVRALAARHGVPVIEDAAQHAGATLGGAPLGRAGALTVLSFGRGKGTTGGSGGALLVHDAALVERVETATRRLVVPRGAGDVVALAAQWMLGRPSVYAIPASLPMLRLGQMVYHPAHEPASLSIAAATMAARAVARDADEVRVRRANAERLLAGAARGWVPVRALDGAAPGYLRLALRGARGAHAAPALGVMPGYPATLDEHAELRPLLVAGERAGAGARALRDELLTVPTHSLLAERDLARLARWLARADEPRAVAGAAYV